MAISIQTNVNALTAQDNLRVTSDFQSKTIARLTSGYRINSSGDDAAGLAVANKFRSDTAELTQGVRNANDGISQLQIIDGGANNISKILDRMKTLATQAASTTFTGSRTTLDTEFQALKGEINRQASNVGLQTNGTYNTSMSIYIGGGGSNQSNAKVTVDLSGGGNAIDSTGLGVSGTGLLSGGVALGSVDISGSGSTFLTANAGVVATEVFTFNLGNVGTQVSATVSGGANGAGITGANAVSQLNASLNSSGISASIGTGGALTFSSSSAFTIAGPTALVGAGAAGTIATLSQNIENTGMYRTTGTQVWSDLTAGGSETLAFSQNGVTKSVALAGVTTLSGAISQINSDLSSAGIKVTAMLDKAGTSITYQSSSDFTLQKTAGAGVLGSMAGAGAGTLVDATDPTAGSSPTANALSALNSLSVAVTNLGSAQGKIGTGQNMLAYAINLAQSQISGFSAAESRIRDADVASEAANLTKAQVMVQASMAAMAQANSAPQAVLSLLRG